MTALQRPPISWQEPQNERVTPGAHLYRHHGADDPDGSGIAAARGSFHRHGGRTLGHTRCQRESVHSARLLLVCALVGDCVMYWIGYHFGRGVLRDRRWFSRWVTPEREEHIEEMFHLHGLKVFFVARFLVGLRTPVYLTAGILRLSFKKFVLIDLVCAATVVSSFFGLAYYFGANISKWIRRGQLGLTISVVIAVACVAFFLWRRYRRKKSASPGKKRLEDVLLPPAKKEPPTSKKEGKGSVSSSAEMKHSPSDNGDGKKSRSCQPEGLHSDEGEERAV